MIPLVRARTLGRILWIGAALAVGMHLLTYGVYVWGGRRSLGLLRHFDLDFEGNVAVWFSSAVLLVGAMVLAGVGLEARRAREPYARHWLALSLIFVYLSADEAGQIHEVMQGPMDELVSMHGWLTYAWVIPGAVIALILGLAFLRFIRNLPNPTRRWVIVSGAAFVLGALVIETYGGMLSDELGYDSTPYQMEVAVEEGFELFGASTFIWAIARYAEQRRTARMTSV
jgi:hypothetical protein